MCLTAVLKYILMMHLMPPQRSDISDFLVLRVRAPTWEVGPNYVISATGWCQTQQLLWVLSCINIIFKNIYQSQKRKSQHLFVFPNSSRIRCMYATPDFYSNCLCDVVGAALFTHINVCIAVQTDLCVHVNINMVDGNQARLEMSEASGLWRKSLLQILKKRLFSFATHCMSLSFSQFLSSGLSAASKTYSL